MSHSLSCGLTGSFTVQSWPRECAYETHSLLAPDDVKCPQSLLSCCPRRGKGCIICPIQATGHQLERTDWFPQGLLLYPKRCFTCEPGIRPYIYWHSCHVLVQSPLWRSLSFSAPHGSRQVISVLSFPPSCGAEQMRERVWRSFENHKALYKYSPDTPPHTHAFAHFLLCQECFPYHISRPDSHDTSSSKTPWLHYLKEIMEPSFSPIIPSSILLCQHASLSSLFYSFWVTSFLPKQHSEGRTII